MNMNTRNRAFIGAYKKGYAAHQTGDECPYADRRGGRHDHVITYSRAFQNYWKQGLADARDGVAPRWVIEVKDEQ